MPDVDLYVENYIQYSKSVFGNSELGEWELRGGSSLGDWAWEVDIYSHSLVWYLMGIPIEI